MIYTCCWLLTLDMDSIEMGWKFWRICRLGAQFLLTLHSHHIYAFLPAWDFMKDYNYHEMLKKGKTPDAWMFSKLRAVLKALPDQKANGGELQQQSIWENPSKNATFFLETWKTTKSMLTPIDWETQWKPHWKFTGTWQNSLLSPFLDSTMGFCIQQIVVKELSHQKTLCLALGLVLCTYMVAIIYNLKVRCCSVT